MHKQFADWYRAAGIEPDATTLPKRWKGAADFGVDAVEVAELVRLLYGVGQPAKKFVENFRNSLQKADSTVAMKGNEHELRVLAGAALIDTIDRSDKETADFAALGTVAAAAQNLRQTAAVPDIPELAAEYLRRKSADRDSRDPESDAVIDDQLASSIAAACATGAPQHLAAPLQKLVDELGRIARVTSGHRRQMKLQAEETNILWWLFGEYSRDLEQRLADLPFPAACIIAGKELADLTETAPGPPAVIAFLDRALRRSDTAPETVMVGDAINAVPESWRQSVAESEWPEPFVVLTPITLGIRISLTAPANNEWFPAFRNAVGFSADATISPRALAHQVYLETLLRRVRPE